MRRYRGPSPHVVVVAMFVVALLAAMVSGIAGVASLGSDAPTARSAPEPLDGYPQRIGFQRPSPKLPDRPGPLAATMEDNNFGELRVLGVTSRGRLWELPGWVNALSQDGRLLLTAESSTGSGRLAVHDLSSGDRRVFDGIGRSFESQEPHVLDPYAPVYWSQDGSAILSRFGDSPHPDRSKPSVLDVASGVLTALPGDQPAGFLQSPSEAVTVTLLVDNKAAEGIVVTTTDVETGKTHDLPLNLDGPWTGDPENNLGASVSPDGSTLLLVEVAEDGSSEDSLRLFSLTDGSELQSRNIRDWDGCSPAWLDDDPVLPTKDQAAGSALVTADGSRSLVAVHHRLQSSCLQLTAAALSAGPHRALFGTWTYLWTWYWWQLLLVGSLALFAFAWVLWRRQQRYR